MTTMTATTARREFFDLVKGAAEGHKTFRIQHRQGAAVLLSETDYDGLLETLELLSIPGFHASIKKSVAQMQRGETVALAEALGDQA